MKKFVLVTLLICLMASFSYGQTKKKGTTHRRKTHTSASTTKPSTTTNSNAITTESGLTYVITHHTEGRKPKEGDTISVHYTGTLTDGTKFDSSKDRGTPIVFKIGVGQVIKGWDEGIAKLGVGEQGVLIIPPSLGYGERGAGGVIPPNATLIFVVELVGIQEQQ